MIEIRRLSHEYKKDSGKSIRTLWDIDLDIVEGTFVSIIGHNGSGKSTFAKHLNGLILPQAGTILIDGQPMVPGEGIWDIRRKVGMVFQNPDNQFVGGTIEEDIAFGLENIGLPTERMDDRIHRCAALVGMEEHLKRPPHLLSGGQKQRSAIGAVIAMEPAYLVLDEPTSMLDPKGRLEVIRVLRDLNEKEGITIILITHFMDEVVYSDQVLVMDQGRIAMKGTPKEVFRNREELKKIGLELPRSAILQEMLADQGLVLPGEVLTKEELVEALWA